MTIEKRKNYSDIARIAVLAVGLGLTGCSSKKATPASAPNINTDSRTNVFYVYHGPASENGRPCIPTMRKVMDFPKEVEGSTISFNFPLGPTGCDVTVTSISVENPKLALKEITPKMPIEIPRGDHPSLVS